MTSDAPDSAAVIRYFEELQAQLCARLEAFEGEARFGVDAWSYGDGGDGGDGERHSHSGDGDIEPRHPRDIEPRHPRVLLSGGGHGGDAHGGGGGDKTGAVQLMGRGVTRVIQGEVFEKGGVNFSHVTGDKLPAAATVARPHLAGRPFEAAGVSVVMHPRNPFVPTCHMNVRFFRAGGAGDGAGASDIQPRHPRVLLSGGGAGDGHGGRGDGDGDGAGGHGDGHGDSHAAGDWWFGGGYDLTPYYPFDADCIHWHQTAKRACDRFDRDYYPRFKAACDAYFYLKHRRETRGIGGLFFDDFRGDGGGDGDGDGGGDAGAGDFTRAFEFTRAIGDSFAAAYAPIVERRRGLDYGEREREFQQHRRGRYVEFNLVFDRGTLFGLQSGARAESILMSLPPLARWGYHWRPEPGSPEARLADYLKPRDWAGESTSAATVKSSSAARDS